MLERLVPDGAFRAQLVAFWEGQPIVRQRFPGGIVQFAQWAGQMPEDALEDLFLAIAAAGEEGAEGAGAGAEGGMPGGMPGGEVMVEFVDPDEEEDVDDLPGVPLGAAPAAHEEDEDEEEEEEEEQVAVCALHKQDIGEEC